MEQTADRRAGVLIIRMWLEDAGDRTFSVRARITSTLDLTSGQKITASAATIAGILDVVRSHLELFSDGEANRFEA